MGWRSVVIGNPATLALKNHALLIRQKDQEARVMLEDINVLVLEHVQITLTAPLLSACAEAQIAVITIGETHLPNGMLLPYLPHSRALQVMNAQLAMKLPKRKRLWQRIVCQKILNQAAVLSGSGRHGEVERLIKLSNQLRSGDPKNLEARAAQLYFKSLIEPEFSRKQSRFYNAAMNYGYAVIRACIARTLVRYGFLPAFGIFHRSEQNAFNLADDLLEPYRPLVDAATIRQFQVEPERELEPEDKALLTGLLHEDIKLTSHGSGERGCTLLSGIDATVSTLSGIMLADVLPENLALPILEVMPAMLTLS